MEIFKEYARSLGSVDQDLLKMVLTNIVAEGREERIKELREKASVLRKYIDSVHKTIESLKGDLSIVLRTIKKMRESAFVNTTDISFVLAIFEGYAVALRDKIGELRPDAELKEKAQIEMLCDALESRRSIAVKMERALGDVLKELPLGTH